MKISTWFIQVYSIILLCRMHELLVRVAYTHLPFFTFITGAVTSLTLENFDGVTEIKVHLRTFLNSYPDSTSSAG